MSSATYTQGNRPISVTTPLGKDKLLLVGFSGSEAISRPFKFQLELKADNKNVSDVAFDKLLGQKITVELRQADNKMRYFSGICSRFSQGERGTVFSNYRMEIV